jgi:hypothetical protein
MGFFTFVFGEVDILAVVAFIFATLFITSGLKALLAKSARWCAVLDNDFAKVCLSWIVGAAVFAAMHLTLHAFPVTEQTIVQFAVWVLLLNGGYRIVTTVRDYIRDWKSKP